MARKRLESSGLKTWGEADNALLEIGRLERRIEKEESDLQETIAQAKEATAAAVKKLQNQIKLWELQLKDFGQEYKADLGEKKSRTVNFGLLGFRFSTKIILPRGKAACQAVIDKLKSLKLGHCIKTTETILKEEVKKLDEATLSQLEPLGVRKDSKDAFFYEVNRERVQEAA